MYIYIYSGRLCLSHLDRPLSCQDISCLDEVSPPVKSLFY